MKPPTLGDGHLWVQLVSARLSEQVVLNRDAGGMPPVQFIIEIGKRVIFTFHFNCPMFQIKEYPFCTSTNKVAMTRCTRQK